MAKFMLFALLVAFATAAPTVDDTVPETEFSDEGLACVGLYPCSNFYRGTKRKACCCNKKTDFASTSKCSPKKPDYDAKTTCTINVGGYNYPSTTSVHKAKEISGSSNGVKNFRYLKFKGCREVNLHDDDSGGFWGKSIDHVTLKPGGKAVKGVDCCTHTCKFSVGYFHDLASDVSRIYYKACPTPKVKDPRTKGKRMRL
jgi:hypothetical protein